MNYCRKLLILPALVCAFIGYSQYVGARDQQPGPGAKSSAKIDLNSAGERELMSLPDITFPLVRKIMANRPYENTHQLVTRGIITEATYTQIRDLITVKEPPPKRVALQTP